MVAADWNEKPTSRARRLPAFVAQTVTWPRYGEASRVNLMARTMPVRFGAVSGP